MCTLKFKIAIEKKNNTDVLWELEVLNVFFSEIRYTEQKSNFFDFSNQFDTIKY